MQTSSQKSVKVEKLLLDKRLEQERMQDVMLLLENLAEREKDTIKIIIDCLYDVGSVNLANQKLRSRTLNGLTQAMARMSKPAFRFFAWRWFRKNSPELITNWLKKKISFQTQAAKPPQTLAAPVTDTKPQYLLAAEKQTQEIKMLRSQVKFLTLMLLGAITIFGSSSLWLSYSLQQEGTQAQTQLRSSSE